MRYFIALRFNDETNQQLSFYQRHCSDHGYKGKQTSYTNFHLTLLFIGTLSMEEVERLDNALSHAIIPSFHLMIQGLGFFKRKSKETIWAKSLPSEQLQQLQQSIVQAVKGCAIDFAATDFTPHITLLRNSTNTQNVDVEQFIMPKIDVEVNEFYLMKSWHVQDILTYTPIYAYKLDNHASMID